MWECREPKGGGEIGRREGGQPLKLQRGTGKGETRQRAKEDAKRTRPSKEGESMWEIYHVKNFFRRGVRVETRRGLD